MKELLKQAVRGLCCVIILPVYLGYLLAAAAGNRDSAFSGASQLVSMLPGIFGVYLRNAFFWMAMQHCELGVFIGFGVLFSQQRTEVAEGVYIGPQCNIGLCRIGQGVLLGSGVHLLSGKHQHSFSDLDTPIQQQGGTYSKISIGDDSWIGNGALVMADVGRKCIVGAGAVVTSPVEDFSIVAGNPAVIVKKRQ
jgi:acetyltransferase-like isoleucine patch superfamily enzyme